MARLQKLFRDEVMQARRGQWLGVVHLAVPLSFVWLGLLASALIVATVVFMVFGHYTRYQRVSGRLVPSAGLLSVRTPTRGTVARLYVRQGETVRRGDPLIEIADERSSVALGSTQGLIDAQLRAEAVRLRKELTNQQQFSKEESDGLNAKLHMLEEQRAQTVRRIALAHKQLTNAQALLDKMQLLENKGHVSVVEAEQRDSSALQLQLSVLQIQQEIQSLTSQELTTRQQIAAVKQSLDQIPLVLAAKQGATWQALSQNDQQLVQNEPQKDVVLRAPADGLVSTLLVKSGQPVAAEQPLLSVLPKGSTLQAQLLVPSNAVGFIRPGNRVVMRYQAFPYQEFGLQYGNVASVSLSALNSDEVTLLTGGGSPQPLYRVLVDLQQQQISAYGRSNSLRPGMAISAEILLNRRSLWQWAFMPLSDLRRQAGARASRS